MSPTATKNGIDPGLNVNLDWQSLSASPELSTFLPFAAPPSGSSSPPLPPEQGSQQWLQQWGTTGDDTIADMAVDRFGNIYLAGSTTGELFINWGIDRSDSDGWLAKFNSNGQLLWGKQILTPFEDIASRVTVDDTGNVYVAGTTQGVIAPGVTANDFGPDTWLTKYDSNGNILWSQQKEFSSVDSIGDLEVDRLGNVYMTGHSYSSRSVGSRQISWVERYNSSNGARTWGQSYSIGFYGEVKNITSRGLAIDGSNNLYVTLNIGGWMRYGQPSSGDPHPHWNNGVWRSGIEEDGRGSLVSKYDVTGNLIWQKYLGGEDGAGDRITAGNFGNFYLRGENSLAKYNSNGDLLWEHEDLATTTSITTPIATTNIAVDAAGSVYLSGKTANNNPWVAKYYRDGIFAWEKEFGASEDDVATGVAINASGQVYLAGNTLGTLAQINAGENDIWLTQFQQIPTDSSQAPQSLTFSLDRSQYKATDTLTVTNGWVQDPDGAIDITHVELLLFTHIGSSIGTIDIPNIMEFTPASWSTEWVSFTYNLDLSGLNLSEGDYRLIALAYDRSRQTSSSLYQDFSIYSNSAPEQLSFGLGSNQYQANETLTLKNAWVYDKDGGNDIASIDFKLMDEMGNAIDLEDATQFNPVTWSHQWANFDYSLNLSQLGLNLGIYTLQGIAYDVVGAASAAFERQFAIYSNSAPEQLIFGLESNQYEANETLTLKNAWVYDKNGGNDLASIDFKLMDEMGNEIDLEDVTQFNLATWSHQWANFDYSLDFSGLGLDGGIYTLQGTAYDLAGAKGSSFERKFELSGPAIPTLAWLQDLNGSGVDVAVDSVGNLYVTGNLSQQDGHDIWVAKYDGNGNLLWRNDLESPREDVVQGMEIDSMGNVYLTGSTNGDLAGANAGGGYVNWLAKYDSQGNLSWIQQSDINVFTRNIMVDNTGNIYLKDSIDPWMEKYNSNGSLLWSKQLASSDSRWTSTAIDSAGNIYLTETVNTISGSYGSQGDTLLKKYNSNGNLIWTIDSGKLNVNDSARVNVDFAGNIYLTGYELVGQSPTTLDVWAMGYNSNGQQLWTQQLETQSYNIPYGVTVDGWGDLYITGNTGTSFAGSHAGGMTDIWITKFDGTGNLTWKQQDGTQGSDWSWDVSVDGDRNIYLLGSKTGTNWIAKYS